jgi:2-methylcitrate dehydratase PrpD
MGATERLAKFVVGLNYDDIPANVRELSKHLILDFIGVTLTGSLEPLSPIVNKFVKELGDGSDTRILGSGVRTSVTNAAFANGVMSHVLDYDDAWYWPTGHPSYTVIPVILALGEKLKLCGKEAIVSHVLGLETHGKIGAAVIKSAPSDTSWHGVGTFGCQVPSAGRWWLGF